MGAENAGGKQSHPPPASTLTPFYAYPSRFVIQKLSGVPHLNARNCHIATARTKKSIITITRPKARFARYSMFQVYRSRQNFRNSFHIYPFSCINW